jgi:archaellum component FlaC
MATTVERLGIVETKVANLDEKIDEIKVDVNQLGSGINSRLDQMYDASCTQHAELAKSIKNTHTELDAKISELQQFKQKWMYLVLGGIAVLGFVSGHFETLVKIFH